MSVVEASKTSESSSDSVHVIGYFNPTVVGEVLNAGGNDNPLTIENEDEVWPGFRREALEATNLPMPSDPPTTKETAAGQEPVPPVEPVQPTQPGQTQQQTVLPLHLLKSLGQLHLHSSLAQLRKPLDQRGRLQSLTLEPEDSATRKLRKAQALMPRNKPT